MVSRLVGGASHISSSVDARHHDMGPWARYTPTWSSSGTQPTVGDATLTGGYRRYGTTLHVHAQLIVGSTSGVGTGDFRLGLPSGMTAISYQHQSMAAFWFDGSTLVGFVRVALAEPGTGYVTFMDSVGGRAGTGGLGAGDYMNFGGTIEIDL